MKQITSQIEISASPDQVWQVLVDFAAYPKWNPFMRRAEGELRAGGRLKVHFKPSKGMGMTIKLTVLKAEPGRELRWIGHLLMAGLFNGEHYFTIESLKEGRVRFVQGEVFTGVLVPLMAAMGGMKNTLLSFGEMNAALKERAEKVTA